jgi:hypothetical protein
MPDIHLSFDEWDLIQGHPEATTRPLGPNVCIPTARGGERDSSIQLRFGSHQRERERERGPPELSPIILTSNVTNFPSESKVMGRAVNLLLETRSSIRALISPIPIGNFVIRFVSSDR